MNVQTPVILAISTLLFACSSPRTIVTQPFASGPASPASFQTADTVPVRWARGLRLASLSAVGAEMATPLESEIEVTDRFRHKAVARDCNSALDLLAKGYEAPRDVEQRVLRYQSIRCLALRAIATAAPARRSGIEQFHLSEGSVNVLPPTLGLAVSDEAADRAREAESQGKSWRDVSPGARVRLEPPMDDRLDPSLVVEGDGWRVRVTEYGRADFDRDGNEDLMVRVDGERTPGTYRSHRLFVLTWDPGRRAFRMLREILPD